VLTGVEMWIGILVGGVIVIGYTVLGGYFAVAWTDYLQGAIILAAFAVLPVLALGEYGLPFEQLATMDASLTSPVAGASGWAALFGLISYAAIGLGVPGNPHIMVRFMGIDRVEDIRLAAVVAQLFMFVAYIGAALVGLYALVAFGQGSIANTDTVMPRLTLELFPPIVAGIVLAAALAAMMSSADSQLLVATSAVVEDIYRGFFDREATERELVRYSRLVTLLIGTASVTFAYLARETPIYTLVLDYAWGGLGAALGPTLIAALWWRRLTAKGATASMLVGASTMILWTQWGTILGAVGIGLPPEATFLYGLVTVYGLFPAFVLSTLTLVIVSLLTTPPERGTVDEHFAVFGKPLPAIGSDDGADGDYATDGGGPRACTELDAVRHEVATSDYWEHDDG